MFAHKRVTPVPRWLPVFPTSSISATHGVLIEAPVAEIGIFPGRHLQLTALFDASGIQTGVVQAPKTLGPLMLVENVDSPVAPIDAFLHEGQHHAVFVVAIIEEGADMATAVHRRPRQICVPAVLDIFCHRELPAFASRAVALFVLCCRAAVPFRLETAQTTVALLRYSEQA
jgi:hypothetical protein